MGAKQEACNCRGLVTERRHLQCFQASAFIRESFGQNRSLKLKILSERGSARQILVSPKLCSVHLPLHQFLSPAHLFRRYPPPPSSNYTLPGAQALGQRLLKD